MQLHMNSRPGILATTVQNEQYKSGAEYELDTPSELAEKLDLDASDPYAGPLLVQIISFSRARRLASSSGFFPVNRAYSEHTVFEHYKDAVRLVLLDLG